MDYPVDQKCEDTKLIGLAILQSTWMTVRLYLPIVVAFFGASAFSFAGDAREQRFDLNASQASSQSLQSSVPQIETEAQCGLSCRYHKANDNITIQALYLINKMKLMDEALLNDRGDDVLKAAGPICANIDDASACMKRFKSFQAFALLQLRQAMGKNEDAMARLTHGRQDDGSVSGQYTAIAVEKGKPYTPDVPTLSELQKSFESGNNEKKKYSHKQLKNWTESLMLSNPKASLIEFGKKPVAGNPHNKDSKSGFQLIMQDKDGAGNPRPVSKREQQIYDRSKQEIEFAQKEPLRQHESTDVITPKQILGKGQGKDSADSISYEAYTETRSLVIDKVNQESKKDLTQRNLAQKTVVKKVESGAAKGEAKVEEAKPETQVRSEQGVALKKDTPKRNLARDDEKIATPKEIKNSRYIRYDVNDMMNSIEETTKESQ